MRRYNTLAPALIFFFSAGLARVVPPKHDSCGYNSNNDVPAYRPIYVDELYGQGQSYVVSTAHLLETERATIHQAETVEQNATEHEADTMQQRATVHGTETVGALRRPAVCREQWLI